MLSTGQFIFKFLHRAFQYLNGIGAFIDGFLQFGFGLVDALLQCLYVGFQLGLGIHIIVAGTFGLCSGNSGLNRIIQIHFRCGFFCGGLFTKEVVLQMMADAGAAEAMATLEHYKTDPLANNDPALLVEARQQAADARELATTPQTLGAEALAEVWGQGWQLTSFDTDAVNAHFRDIDALTRQATRHESGEGMLARAIFASAVCARLPAADSRREGLCQEASERFSEAKALLLGDDRAWLRFEVWWTAAEHHNRLAAGWWGVGQSENAAAEWLRTLTICGQGSSDISAAPVNDIFLARPCLVAAGGTQHYTEYVGWARWLRGHDEAAEGTLSDWSAAHIYRAAAPDCQGLTRSSTRTQRWIPRARSDDARRCYYAGLMALSCEDAAREVRGYLDRSDPLLDAVLQASTPMGQCYLD